MKLLFSMFLAYPLAGILKRLPDAEAWKKNLFIILYACPIDMALKIEC